MFLCKVVLGLHTTSHPSGLATGGASIAVRTGDKTSKFAQTFGRATAPLAPNRPLCAVYFVFLKKVKLNFNRFTLILKK